MLLIGWSPLGTSARTFKTHYFNYFGALWVYRALGDMLNSIVSNCHFGKRLAARVMTIFSLHFLLSIYFLGILLVFEHCWGTLFPLPSTLSFVSPLSLCSYPFVFFPRGCRPLDPWLWRTSEWWTHVLVHLFFILLKFVGFVCGGLRAMVGISFLFVVKYHVECISNHVWGPPGSRDITIFVKTYICIKIIRVISVDDDLFPGYQRFWLSATKIISF